MSLSSLERSLAGELQRVDEIQQWDLDSSSRAVALEAARRQPNQLEPPTECGQGGVTARNPCDRAWNSPHNWLHG